MPKKANFLDGDAIILSAPSSIVTGTVRSIIPSRNFILSKIKCKSYQIILEGLAYE